MRFLSRSLIGLFLTGLTLGVLILAAGQAYRFSQQAAESQGNRRAPAERTYSVNVADIVLQDATPVITGYGNIASARLLELRTGAAGELIELAPDFRDGGAVSSGSLLFQIDPVDARLARDRSRTQLTEAEADLSEAVTALDLAQEDARVAVAQRDLWAQALTRQEDLRTRGVGTDAAVENAALSLAAADQTVVGRRQALLQAEGTLARRDTAVDRARIALEEAERTLANTTARAPFDGLLSEVDAVLGRRVSNNERLGVLIDPASLEVAFQVTNAQFARLLDDRQNLRPLPVAVTLDLGDIPFTAPATLVRAGAQVGEGQTGRQLYAQLEPGAAGVMRSGDFVTVEITEPALANVALIPATAASADGKVLVLVEGNRLAEQQTTILRRQGDDIIVSGLEAGVTYVTQRQPQLGAGLAVTAVRGDAGLQEIAMVTLDPARAERLIAAVEANTRMPAEAKERMLRHFRSGQAPEGMVARLEARMNTAPQTTTPTLAAAAQGVETISLTPERRDRIRAFVEGSARMGEEAKARVLTALENPEVPRAMVERIEARMGS
ncbi:MAG: HlyD family efflux transporter periplasmic adaptor subunit [Pseudomonadota bacterium]